MKIAQWALLILGLGMLGGGTRIANKLQSQKEKQTSQYSIADSIYKRLQENETKDETVISLFGPEKPKEYSPKEETITIERNGLPPIEMTKPVQEPRPETLGGIIVTHPGYSILFPKYLDFPKTDNPHFKYDEDLFQTRWAEAADMIINNERMPYTTGSWDDDLMQGVWLLYHEGDLQLSGYVWENHKKYFKTKKFNRKEQKRLAKQRFEEAIEDYRSWKSNRSWNGKKVDPNIIKAFEYLDSLADKLPD